MKGLLNTLALAVAVTALTVAPPLPAAAQRSADAQKSAAAAQPGTIGVFDPMIRTVTRAVDSNPLAPPVLTLGADSELTIGFDMIAEQREYLRYSIHLCNADWSPSQFTDPEVFDGFNYADIQDYAFSSGTNTHYVHYTISLPNQDYQFRLSGNYILDVYPEENPDNILLSVPFMVQENAISVGGSITSVTDIDINGAHQQLSLEIDTRNERLRDPNNDLRILVQQNNRRDNAVWLAHPDRVSGPKLIYEHNRRLIFPAGNEYRRMETVNNLYPGIGEDHIEFHAPYYYHILNLDKIRAHRQYVYDRTQQGRFLIREYNADNSDTEADYTLVVFTLDATEFPDADVYLDGDFMNRTFDDRSRMGYDPEQGRYTKILPLKQGAYNYQYLVVPRYGAPVTPLSPDSPLPSARSLTAPVEGDHYQTVNEYSVAVYYRPPAARYDRLLSYRLLSYQ